MTQHNIQSVHNEEVANKTVNIVPTFDEIYAMDYVQNSIKSILFSNSQNYPMMAPYEDDIRQEMLIYLARSLETFNSEKSNIKTYSRLALLIGLRRARRAYFTDTQKCISMAIPLHKLIEAEQSERDLGATTETRNNTTFYAADPFGDDEKREEFYAIFASLSLKDQKIAKLIMVGMTYANICATEICSLRYLYERALPNMRRAFKNKNL